MKRIKAACLMQTLVFSQKEESGLTAEQALKLNREEFNSYRAGMDRNRTRYQITEASEQADGSIIVHVRKEYNSKADVAEYFI